MGLIEVLASFVVGLATSAFLCYIYILKPLWEAHQTLLERMLYMKRQGFVPQYEVEQARKFDPSAEIKEY